MTITSIPSNDRFERFIATTGQTVFPYNFPIYDGTDLLVQQVRSGTRTTLTYSTDYTVTGAQEQSGGNVVLAAGAVAGDIISIGSNQPADRTTQYTDNGDLLAANLNRDFNRLLIALQQLVQAQARGVQGPDYEGPLAKLPKAVDRANLYPAFDTKGELIVTPVAPVGNYTVTPLGASLVQSITQAAACAVLGALAANSGAASNLAVTGLTADGLNGGPVAGWRNRVLNGTFAINEQATGTTAGYVSGTAITAGNYAHDQWKAGAGGCTYTYSQSYPDTTITITAGSLIQPIEGLAVEGRSYTLSWSGTTTARVGINGAAASGAYAASPIIVTGVTAGQQVNLEFSTGTLGKVQFEPGVVATPFERRPLQFELQACQRYLRLVDVFGIGLAAGIGSYCSATGILSPPMRATPTLTPYATISADINCGAVTFDNATTRGFRAFGTSAGSSGFSFFRTVACNARL